jgi:pimeloyl-ACP methyl ester carboxylesterase
MCGCYLKPRRSRVKPRAAGSEIVTPAGPTSGNFISQRQRLHYADWGNEGAPTLLLLHGACDHCRSWDWTAQALRQDWHVIAPDLRGHGDSVWSAEGSYEISGFIYDLAQLFRQFDNNQVSIVAHSYGAHIALRFAALFPEAVRKLVAVEAVAASAALSKGRYQMPADMLWRHWIEEKQAAALRTVKRYATIDEAVVRMKAANPRLSDSQARHLTVHGVRRNEDGSWSWKFDDYMKVWPSIDLSRSEIQGLWRKVTCPTLLLYGKQSWEPETPREELADALPNRRIVEFERSGHWLQHDQFDDFITVLREFL